MSHIYTIPFIYKCIYVLTFTYGEDDCCERGDVGQDGVLNILHQSSRHTPGVCYSEANPPSEDDKTLLSNEIFIQMCEDFSQKLHMYYMYYILYVYTITLSTTL